MAMPQRIPRWTLAELDRLPEDGNRYELVRGELFVTPPPSVRHQNLIERLAALLQPYVTEHRLGQLSFPRSVVRGTKSQVEPDLMVRPIPAPTVTSWEEMPPPILVVEALSGTTRQRDLVSKRGLYLSWMIPEYWIIDGEERVIRVVRPGTEDALSSSVVTWHPEGATAPFTLDVPEYFRGVLGD